MKKKTRTERKLHVAGVFCHPRSNFTEIKSYVEAIFTNLGVTEWEIKETKHPSFIPGRVAAIGYKRKNIGVLGELHPEVLNKFELENPTSAFEVDLEKIFKSHIVR
jgi:phenylalanyl-tRNA synthetase beta chain